jgi:hypothetical protein
MELPIPTMDALLGYQQLTSELLQWSSTVHMLVRERIADLAAAYGPYNHPLETAAEYAERVLAQGQHPFPDGVSIYDDLNSNIGYGQVQVDSAGGEVRVVFTGWWPHWAADGSSYERRLATIHCPGWLLSAPDGISRFRQQTADMVMALRRERSREDAALDALIDEALNRAATKQRHGHAPR